MLFGKKRLNQGSLVLPPNWKWCVHKPKKFLTKNPRSIGITNGKARNPITPNSGEIRGPAIFCCQCDCCITNAFQTIEQRVQPPKATTARCHVSCGMVCVFTWQLHHNQSYWNHGASVSPIKMGQKPGPWSILGGRENLDSQWLTEFHPCSPWHQMEPICTDQTKPVNRTQWRERHLASASSQILRTYFCLDRSVFVSIQLFPSLSCCAPHNHITFPKPNNYAMTDTETLQRIVVAALGVD